MEGGGAGDWGVVFSIHPIPACFLRASRRPGSRAQSQAGLHEADSVPEPGSQWSPGLAAPGISDGFLAARGGC